LVAGSNPVRSIPRSGLQCYTDAGIRQTLRGTRRGDSPSPSGGLPNRLGNDASATVGAFVCAETDFQPCGGTTLPQGRGASAFFLGGIMELVIILMCVLSGLVISRPIVRALGLR